MGGFQDAGFRDAAFAFFRKLAANLRSSGKVRVVGITSCT
jgi:hypothetical protein